MAIDDDRPSLNELEELEDLMKQAGWPSDLRDDRFTMAANDTDAYDHYYEVA